MTESEFLERSAVLCKRLGKWPEWEEDENEPSGRRLFSYNVLSQPLAVWAVDLVTHERTVWRIICNHEALCIMREFWRVWLDEQSAIMVLPSPDKLGKYYHTKPGGISEEGDYNTIQIAAVEAVLAEEEGDGTA